MTEKRFVTGGYKIYDTYKEDEYLVNNVDAQRIVDIMNNLDTKARERSKALSKLQKENEQLKCKIELLQNEIDMLNGKGIEFKSITDLKNKYSDGDFE